MRKARFVLGFFFWGEFWRIFSMFRENTFEVPREMPESIISGACEHNPRTPIRQGLVVIINNFQVLLTRLRFHTDSKPGNRSEFTGDPSRFWDT